MKNMRVKSDHGKLTEFNTVDKHIFFLTELSLYCNTIKKINRKHCRTLRRLYNTVCWTWKGVCVTLCRSRTTIGPSLVHDQSCQREGRLKIIKMELVCHVCVRHFFSLADTSRNHLTPDCAIFYGAACLRCR